MPSLAATRDEGLICVVHLDARTFNNRKERNNLNGITMGSPNIVVNVSNGHVKWVVFVTARCNRCRCLVASEDHGDDHCTKQCWVVLKLGLVAGPKSTKIRFMSYVWPTACFHAQFPDMK